MSDSSNSTFFLGPLVPPAVRAPITASGRATFFVAGSSLAVVMLYDEDDDEPPTDTEEGLLLVPAE